MKILKWKIERQRSATTTEDNINVEFVAQYLAKEILDTTSIKEISNRIADKLTDELYADVKDALLKHSGMQKIITEIRLQIAKGILTTKN